jgi:hypothetical protein
VRTATAAAVFGDAGWTERHIIEEAASDEATFKACVRDRWISDPDNDVAFGPITRKASQ